MDCKHSVSHFGKGSRTDTNSRPMVVLAVDSRRISNCEQPDGAGRDGFGQLGVASRTDFSPNAIPDDGDRVSFGLGSAKRRHKSRIHTDAA